MEKTGQESTQAASPRHKYVARGLAHHAWPEGAVTPVSVSFVLMPQFTMLAFTAAIEPMRVANQLTGQVLFTWMVFSEDGTPIACSNGLQVVPDGPLPETAPAGYVLVCGGVEPDPACTPGLTSWIRRQWRIGRSVGGVCTGAYALAKAGILNGRRFTLHWENLSAFGEKYPELTPEQRIFCIDDRIVTSAGGAAAADLSLQLIENNYGEKLRHAVMDMCLLRQHHAGEEKQLSSLAARLGTRNHKLLRAIDFLEENLEGEVSLDACADHIAVSRRQLERLFQRYLGLSPLQYLSNMRLQHARALLAETNMGVLDVAIACGFGSSSHFSKCFRKHYGISPHKFSMMRKTEG